MWSGEEAGEVAGTAAEGGEGSGDAGILPAQTLVHPGKLESVAKEPHLHGLPGIDLRHLERNLNGMQEHVVRVPVLAEDPLSGIVLEQVGDDQEVVANGSICRGRSFL